MIFAHRTTNRLTLCPSIALLASTVCACNHAGFRGELSKPEPKPAINPPPAEASEPQDLALNWQVKCGGSAPGVQQLSDRSYLVNGLATNAIIVDEGRTKNVHLSVSIKLCSGSSQKRDVLFIVDVSRSMDYTDNFPGQDDTHNWPAGECGRSLAVKAMVEEIGPANARFGFVVFSGQAKLFPDKGRGAGLQDEKDWNTTRSVMCGASGTTNFQVGFEQAATFFQVSDPDAQKEIYLITDGGNEEGNPLGVVSALKGAGTSIGAAMVKSPADKETDFIAAAAFLKTLVSTQKSQPLFQEVGHARELTAALADFSGQELENAWVATRISGAPTTTGDESALPWHVLSRPTGGRNWAVQLPNQSWLLDANQKVVEVLLKTKMKNDQVPSVLKGLLSLD